MRPGLQSIVMNTVRYGTGEEVKDNIFSWNIGRKKCTVNLRLRIFRCWGGCRGVLLYLLCSCVCKSEVDLQSLITKKYRTQRYQGSAVHIDSLHCSTVFPIRDILKRKRIMIMLFLAVAFKIPTKMSFLCTLKPVLIPFSGCLTVPPRRRSPWKLHGTWPNQRQCSNPERCACYELGIERLFDVRYLKLSKPIFWILNPTTSFLKLQHCVCIQNLLIYDIF